jgi:hypothetical protein
MHVKPVDMRNFCCGKAFRRDEISTHVINVHQQILPGKCFTTLTVEALLLTQANIEARQSIPKLKMRSAANCRFLRNECTVEALWSTHFYNVVRRFEQHIFVPADLSRYINIGALQTTFTNKKRFAAIKIYLVFQVNI